MDNAAIPGNGLDELEPFEGPYDWEEAFRQNPDYIDDTFCQDPHCQHPGCQEGLDPESEVLDAPVAAMVVQAEQWLAIVADIEDD